MGRKARQSNRTKNRKGTGTQGSRSQGHTSQAPLASKAIKDSAVLSAAKHLQVSGRHNGRQKEFWLWTASSDPTRPMPNLAHSPLCMWRNSRVNPDSPHLIKRRSHMVAENQLRHTNTKHTDTINKHYQKTPTPYPPLKPLDSLENEVG